MRRAAPDRGILVVVRTPTHRQIVSPVDSSKERLCGWREDELGARRSNQPIVIRKTGLLLDLQQQASPYAHPRLGVGKGIGDLTLIAQSRDEQPDLVESHVQLAAVLAEKCRLDELTPGEIARTSRLGSNDRRIAAAVVRTPLQPPVQRRTRHPQDLRSVRLGIDQPVQNLNAHSNIMPAAWRPPLLLLALLTEWRVNRWPAGTNEQVPDDRLATPETFSAADGSVLECSQQGSSCDTPERIFRPCDKHVLQYAETPARVLVPVTGRCFGGGWSSPTGSSAPPTRSRSRCAYTGNDL